MAKGKKAKKSTSMLNNVASSPVDHQPEPIESDDFDSPNEIPPRIVSLTVTLKGESEGELIFSAVFNNQIVLDGPWFDGSVLYTEKLALNLNDPYSCKLVADLPLVLLCRSSFGKGSGEADILANPENALAATVDLLPLAMGEELIHINVPLLNIQDGEKSNLLVNVEVSSGNATYDFKVPVMFTLLSAHCIPNEELCMKCITGFNHTTEQVDISFDLSVPVAYNKIIWSSASALRHAAVTGYNLPDEDYFIPDDLEPKSTSDCHTVYWNAMRRILIDPNILKEIFQEPLIIEFACFGIHKMDLKSKHIGFMDARVLLEPGQTGVTTLIKVLNSNDNTCPEEFQTRMDLPQLKTSQDATDFFEDLEGHSVYVTIRIDLVEPIVPKSKIASLFDCIGYQQDTTSSLNNLQFEPPPESTDVDVKVIKKECGALSVHEELSNIASCGSMHLNSTIKRSAANRLFMRVRTMLNQFPPGVCSDIDYQETLTAQHAACRRAVTASFEPQPPPTHLPDIYEEARARNAGYERIAKLKAETRNKLNPDHPRTYLINAIHFLETSHDTEALECLKNALKMQSRNRFILWCFGAQLYDKGEDYIEKASAAFRIAVKSDYSDGTANAIGWAVLHTLYHYDSKPHAAFVALKKMRKSYELPEAWGEFLKRWRKISGEEEKYWNPALVNTESPFIIAAAFFLCLRGYHMTESLLQCHLKGCDVRGSRHQLDKIDTSDVHYIRAASWFLRKHIGEAIATTEYAIKKYGIHKNLCEMKLVCKLYADHEWDEETVKDIETVQNTGTELNSFLLLKISEGSLISDPDASLRRAAKAHKMTPSAYTALMIGRAYEQLWELNLAERWAAVAVNLEPLLADGWALLAIIALYNRNLAKTRALLRTARQAGPIKPSIMEKLNTLAAIQPYEQINEIVVKDLCFCQEK